MATKKQIKEWNEVLTMAHESGIIAAQACTPTPMGVHNPDTGQNWVIEGGPCGFAWINVFNARSAFCRWLKKEGHASKSYSEPGLIIWVSHFGQSMQKKVAYADAYSEILREMLEAEAYAGSRMD